MARDEQFYSVIGDDCEIAPNSGLNFLVTITDDFAASSPIKELADSKNFFAQYKGKQIEFLIYDINNFKLNREKLVARQPSKTPSISQDGMWLPGGYWKVGG